MKNISDFKEKFLKKIKEDKRVLIIIAVGVLGMALIFLSELKPASKGTVKADESSAASYEEITEQKLRALVESIEGAGRAEVMLTFDSSKEEVFAKDTDEDVEKREKETAQKTKNKYIIVENDKGENGLITKSVYPRVCGVAIVCDGADDSVIKQRIVETVSALFDINSTNISVVRKAG